ncbi:UbiA family prenyltransferase, partial [bacterium]|nr:UbiA family prenyltransferase [bacterium]
ADACVGAWLQACGDFDAQPALWSAAAVFAAVAGANAFNDWTDWKADAVNRPDRPLPSGVLSPGVALRTGVAAYAAAVALSAQVGAGAVDVVLLWVLATVAYSLVLKGIPALGNIVAAAVTSSVVLLGALSQGRPIAAPALVAVALAFLLNLAREFIKDVQDVAGDSEAGVHTLAVVAGTGVATMAARVVVVVSMLAVFVPLALRLLGVWYGAAGLAVQFTLVLTLQALGRRGDARAAGRASALLKVAMVIGLAAVALGVL